MLQVFTELRSCRVREVLAQLRCGFTADSCVVGRGEEVSGRRAIDSRGEVSVEPRLAVT